MVQELGKLSVSANSVRRQLRNSLKTKNIKATQTAVATVKEKARQVCPICFKSFKSVEIHYGKVHRNKTAVKKEKDNSVIKKDSCQEKPTV